MSTGTKKKPKKTKQRRVPGVLWTTGQIASLLRLSPKTVAKYIDDGRIKGFTLPERPERRVHKKELFRFLKKSGFSWALAEAERFP